MSMVVKAVVFDYGQVLCKAQPEESLKEMAGICGITIERFKGAYWIDRLKYDGGDYNGRAYWRAFEKKAGCLLDDSKIEKLVKTDVQSWSHLDGTMVGWLKRLQGNGTRTAILSNLGFELRRHLEDNFDWVRRFDHRTFSCDVRHVKPERKIYEHCLNGLSASPGEVLFIDDRPENIAVAEEMGIRCHRFQGVESLDRVVRAEGLLPILAE